MSWETGLGDRLIDLVDQGLRALTVEPTGGRKSPAEGVEEAPMTGAEREESARLLRVNRAGELAAQALYRSQALFARDPSTARHLAAAAGEEGDHLAWCTERLRELGGHPSRLDPVWYFGSAAIGALAGLGGDAVSLGFVAETEAQVEAHLDDHLGRLPAADAKSRAILTAMAGDEARHGREATDAGGRAMREPVRSLMALGGEVLRRLAYRL
jgi:3-demethoxyubiquinol 3-hydroxylase